MNKPQKLIIFFAVLFVLSLVFICSIFNGIIVLDHSAETPGDGALVTWKGYNYVQCFGEYHEGKRIAKTNNGSYLKEVEEDPSHTFIVIRSFLDQQLLVREDYSIPTSGNITAVFWNKEKISDERFCEAVVQILSVAKTDFEYETDAIFALKENQHMRQLYVCYDDCPIGTDFKGYLGKVDNKWVITTELPDKDNNTVKCYTIPQEYHALLNEYLT